MVVVPRRARRNQCPGSTEVPLLNHEEERLPQWQLKLKRAVGAGDRAWHAQRCGHALATLCPLNQWVRLDRKCRNPSARDWK